MALWAIAEPGYTVVREADPLPPEATYALAPLVVLLLLWSVVVAVQRRRRGPRAGLLSSLALGVALGNALMEIDVMLQPHHAEVMVMEPYDRAPDHVGDGRRPAERAALLARVDSELRMTDQQ